MPRLIFTVTDKMDEDLKKIAKARNMPISNLIRLYLTEGLSKETDTPVEQYEVEMGGDRRSDRS